MIRVVDLHKHFGGVRAVDGATLEIGEGAITGLIGPNGAGKTTLFNVIAGVYPPTFGHVFLADEDITGLRPHQLYRRGLVRTFQATTLFQELTVLDSVLAGRHLQARVDPLRALLGADRARQAAARDKALEILDFFGLAERRDELAMSLPHGLQRALGIAVAFAVTQLF